MSSIEGQNVHGMRNLALHLDAAQSLARWLMRDGEEAEDMVQEAYLKAFRRFNTFRGGDGRGWLLTIVRNTCYDGLRRRGLEARGLAFDEEYFADPSDTPNPENRLLRKERFELLGEAIADLPLEFREVLLLREWEEMSYREIARTAGVAVGTVMSRLNRARKKLQQEMTCR